MPDKGEPKRKLHQSGQLRLFLACRDTNCSASCSSGSLSVLLWATKSIEALLAPGDWLLLMLTPSCSDSWSVRDYLWTWPSLQTSHWYSRHDGSLPERRKLRPWFPPDLKLTVMHQHLKFWTLLRHTVSWTSMADEKKNGGGPRLILAKGTSPICAGEPYSGLVGS